MLIWKKFRQGENFEELLKEFDITLDDLKHILKGKIKGNYDYDRILRSGHRGQLQFIEHLNNRWNPLEPDAPYKDISAYVPEKIREED